MGTLKLLQRAAMGGIERFVYAASSSSYGSGAPVPIHESHVGIELGTPYQITKLVGEMYARYFWKQHDLPTVAVRLFNSYGPGEHPGRYRNVIPNFIYKSMKGESLTIYGDGSDTRDFTYVDDIVEGIVRAAVVPGVEGLAFNLASGRELPIGRMAEAVRELTGSGAPLQYAPTRSWDGTRRRWASIEHARERLGYEPVFALKTVCETRWPGSARTGMKSSPGSRAR